MNEIPGLRTLAKQNIPQNGYIDPVTFCDVNLSNTPKGIRNIGTTAFSTEESKDLNLEKLNEVMTSPTELYTDVLGPDGQETLNQINSFVQKQFVQQFYEAYMAPVAAKDVINRLGEVTSVISNVENMFPAGIAGVLSSNETAETTKWRTAYNYAFSVVELPNGSSTGKDIVYTFNSLAFPPFRKHDVYDLNNSLDEINPDKDVESDRYFDMQNLVYRQNQGTCRNPAFKAVNDNIQTVQYLLSRCFGIESTYMTEWDLSMYIQEGLCSYMTKDDGNGGIQKVPKFITNLTYGLIEDAPVDLSGKSDPEVIEEISTHASVNMAVSTKMAIDGLTTGSHCNELSYEIAAYPLSKYWYPPVDGQNDENKRYYTEKNVETDKVETIEGYLNVPEFISSFFAYPETGEIYNRYQNKNYTALQYRGRYLSNSSKSLLDIIHYNDARNAILTGWMSTDTEGEYHLASGLKNAKGYAINHNVKSNAYSYIPYWKLFYATPGDGMDEYDIFIQDIVASDAPEISFLDVAYTVVGQFTSDNTQFNNFVQGKANESMSPGYHSLSDDDFDFKGIDDSFDSVGNLSFKLPIVGKITIPHTKLLNMFLKKDKQTNKAMAKKDQANALASNLSTLAATTTAQQVDAQGKPITHIEVDDQGNEYEVSNYSVPTEQNLSSNLSYGDGVANYSPMLYGGPHGRYLSPLTLEGYTQLGNELLSKVPTMDPWFVYRTSQVNNLSAGAFTKNYKAQDRNYADAVTVLTMNERESILNGGSDFGIRPKLNNLKWVTYGTGYNYDEITSASGYHWRYSYSSWGNGRGNYYYSSWKVYDYGYRSWQYHDGRISYLWQYRGYWNSTKYGYVSQNFHEDCTISIPDESPDALFKLIPVSPSYVDTQWAWSWDQIDAHIAHDKGFYTTNVNNISNRYHCVDYMIVPDNNKGTIEWANGCYNTTYGREGTAWYNKLKDAYNNGTSETFVSLPISYKGHGVSDSLGILCGVASIVKSKTWTRKWICELHWYQHSRRCWWRRHYYWCAHWEWGWRNYQIDTYNLILRADRIKYFYPFKKLIDIVALPNINDDNRNKDMSDIILRWTVGTKIWNHVTDSMVDIFPLMGSFINKYGVYESIKIPGRYGWGAMYGGSLLKTNGVFFGDIIDVFRKNNGAVKLCTSTRWYQKSRDVYTSIFRMKKDAQQYYWRWGADSTTISLPKERGRDWWYNYYYYISRSKWYIGKAEMYDVWNDNNWWRSDLYTHTSNQSKTLKYWASQYRNEPVYGNEVPILSRNICIAFSAPAMLEYYQGINIQRQFFKIEDVFDVYIDTATQQMAWLQELSDYAQKYITDTSVVQLYELSTDPKIVTITKNAVNWTANDTSKESSPYQTVRNGPFNINPTEDVNYVEALEILVSSYKGTGNVNTLKSLVDIRKSRITTLRNQAVALKRAFNNSSTKWDVLEQFSRLVHNTKQLLHGVVNKHNLTAEMVCFNGSEYRDVLFDTKNDVVVGDSTYNILTNPAAMLWAYLNVLYQNRKYWVNLRMNKRAGSYWNLRNLERVLTFLLANNTAADDVQTAGKSLKSGDDLVLQSRDIKFVQARKSFQDLAISEDVSPVYTGAVWTTVEYLNIPSPESSAEYNAEKNTYKDREIVYIPETYRYAYKPEDGLYYIVSEEINNKVKGLVGSLSNMLANIASRNYIITAEDILHVNTLGEREYSGVVEGNEIASVYDRTIHITLVSGSVDDYVGDANTAFINDLIKYKKRYYNDLIKQYLIGIYIKWRPEHVWTGVDETGTIGAWHTDPFQEEITGEGDPRTRTDVWGIEHTHEGILSAGITFGITENFDMDMFLTNIPNLKNSTVMEALCTMKDGKDWWRIEIPEEIQLLKSLLKTNPKLVPAYILSPDVSGLKANNVIKNTKTALVGAQSTLSPIKEPSEDLLTANTAAALGLNPSDALRMFNILEEKN